MNINEKIMVGSGAMTWLIVFMVEVVLRQHYTLVSIILYFLFLLCFFMATLRGLIYTQTVYMYGVLGVQLACAVSLYLFNPNNITPILLVIWISLLPQCLPAKRWLWVWLGLNTALIVYDATDGMDTRSLVTHLVFMGLQLFAASSSQIRISARQTKEELEQKHLELIATQSLLSEQSEARARLSMARDLHDSIGHKLTVLSLNLEHAIHREPENSPEFFKDLKQSVNKTLDELREIVREVRSEKASSLSEVLFKLSQAMPKGVRLSFPDVFDVATIDLRDQLAFCLREAISNALRHGRATAIDVSLQSAKPLEIRVEDNGMLVKHWREGSGLQGMRERLQTYQGQVTLQPRSRRQGMCLTLFIPKQNAC